ncbi:ubiquitin-like 1-activating enzyme E1 B [Strigomonas culicis]|uniref:SUMO-activating enzyme subunit n=1 Tax=Strigomonas culicis TaxID=28005 RepID=S9U4U5_9TRYP|nr:ubiquitin-like 1-activating enzyme E1 B [Strigomonas culicis]|eukprot:EPY23799.1 ubiquitin-like 1-activating enzyme E1 B [Strigomonas culicis]
MLSGFKNLHILDLDTIDATNLNRQFLFTTEDVGKPKAEAARRTVLSWFQQREARVSAAPTIVALHDNIKDAKFDDAFYRQFAVVLNALDNVSARQHVNFQCMRSGTPLIESGSMGFNGQVQPIVRGISECYQCRPKPPDTQSFAVCTIHARPTSMVHCVHYAKELYESLFGDQQGELLGETGAPQPERLPAAASAPSELAYLRRVALQFHEQWRGQSTRTDGQRSALLYGFAVELLQHLFHHKIEQLLDMKSAWSTAPPVPIAVADITAAAVVGGDSDGSDASSTHGICSAVFIDGMVTSKPTTPLSIKECMQLFIFTVAACASRPTRGFQKEDDAAVRFVAAVSNLRAHVYHLPMQPVEEIRTIAGAIVPAVATTNAMVAAGVVQQLYVLLRMAQCADAGDRQHLSQHLKMIYVRKAPQERRERARACFPFQQRAGEHAEHHKQRAIILRSQVHAAPLPLPNPLCVVCQDVSPTVYVALPRAGAETYTLRDLIDEVVVGQLDMEAPSLFFHDKIVFEDEDYETLAGNTLLSFAGGLEDEHRQRIASGALPLVFVVDAVNHETEWRVEVRLCAVGETQVRGVEAAAKTEERANQIKRARAEESDRQAEVAGSTAAAPATATSGVGDTVTVIDIDDEGDENVIEID